MGLRFASHSAFTPGLIYEEILLKSGAAGAKCWSDAHRDLEKFKFPLMIKEGIYNSVSDLEPGGARCVAVRFDPGWKGGSAGAGLGRTGIAAVPPSASLESMIPVIEERFKEVLASGAEPSIAAFKARKGTEGKLGIQIMPVQGAEYKDESGNTYIWPVISVSYIGKVDEKAMVAVGHGFDGVNFARLAGNYDGYLTDDISRCNIISAYDESQMIDLKSGKIALMDTPDVSFNKIKQGMTELRNILDKQSRAAYLEIVNASLDWNDWVATQYCPFDVELVSKPVVQSYNKFHIVAETADVVGTAVVQTHNVRFFEEYKQKNELREYNMNNSGYLLCITNTYTADFFSYVSLEHYSNAGAIVILAGNKRPLFSHLNGLPRELGIPVLCIDVRKDEFVQSLRKAVGAYVKSGWNSEEEVQEFDRANVDNAKLTVYVKEFSREGLIVRA